jgi:hypothetical protein
VCFLRFSAQQAAEKGPQLRSRLVTILNLPRGYASGSDSPAASLDDDLFEQPVGTQLVFYLHSRQRLDVFPIWGMIAVAGIVPAVDFAREISDLKAKRKKVKQHPLLFFDQLSKTIASKEGRMRTF